jgi:hypothetical protein
MKKIGIIIIVTLLGIFILKTCGDETQENTQEINLDTPKKTYIDGPRNTYESQVEALSISNEIQNPVNTYLNSRLDARASSKKSVRESNKHMDEQNKAMEALTK